MKKPIICLDFDGVVHSYTSGWKGPRCIPDAPVDGAIDFITNLLLDGYDVVIHSSRARYIGGISAMRRWLQVHSGNLWDTMGPSVCEVRFAHFKPPAVLTIDDRGFQFEGKFPSMEYLKKFKPWNKK